MGYTHYWNSAGFTPEQWALVTDDVKKILKTTRVSLLHEYDEPGSKPSVTDGEIFLNGAGDDGHETFLLRPEPAEFEFCKTAYKPYDQVVCAILIIAAKHGPIEVTSDGDAAEWRPGEILATAACGPGYKIPLKD